MNEAGWFAVLETSEVRRRPLGVTRLGRELVFWRKADSTLVVQEDICPHRRTRLSLGSVRDDCIECPFHGFTFDAHGACTRIPAHGDDTSRIPQAMTVRTVPSREAHGFIWVWGDERAEPSGEPVSWFPELDGHVYSGFRSSWNTHFSRAVENQLDYAHLPFVHRTTIGRFASSEAEPELINEPGRVRLRFGGDGKQAGFIEWREPNVWINWVGMGFIMVAFAPVDAETTRMYLRFYHRVKVPIVRQLWEWAMKPMNRLILNQDRAVVEAQTPKESRLRIPEVLVPFDRAIVAYRKQRESRLLSDSPGATSLPVLRPRSSA
ncbi:MAG: aromatic ring-hydroxylating dioxygenase subunit alpha [Deltaproteobacteria bacterium]|nr:aromatic ring-hydroxylating dioxygenase subunit alpha [Deltaproteobacteria bacterium]